VLGEQASELVGLVLLHEVAAAGQDLQARARYAPRELATVLHGNPLVGFAPDDELVGCAEAEQIEGVDREALGKVARDPPPCPGGPRRAVNEDDRWAMSEPVPRDRACAGVKALLEYPRLRSRDANGWPGGRAGG
jgi:hypothetical protein